MPDTLQKQEELQLTLAVVAGLEPVTFALPGEPVIIGRAGECDFRLDQPSVSRRHCQVTFTSGGYVIEDLRSRSGTKVNGGLITEPVLLSPGDTISLGTVQMQVRVTDGAVAGAHPSAVAAPGTPLRGEAARFSLDKPRVVIGRGEEADIRLHDAGISRRHAAIEATDAGYEIVDLESRGGTFINGHRFARQSLVVGDQVQIGPYTLSFDGTHLHHMQMSPGASIVGIDLCQQASGKVLLQEVNLQIEPGQFVGIIGPSGAGKSTLLNILSGMCSPSAGKLLFNGRDASTARDSRENGIGYVPQEDIVHRELTVEEALVFSAKLRLPAGTPPREMQKLVTQVLQQLSLEGHRATPVYRLSGGQRKRVSVGVELLARPKVLLLDEPTSGLDPATEFRLMELLRRLAASGCTVICTTHVMENVHLMDRLAVVAGGRLVFFGPPEEAGSFFGVQRLSLLYDRLEEKPAMEWQKAYQERAAAATDADIPILDHGPSPLRPAGFAFPLLLQRQWRIWRSDYKNFAILLGQPLALGALISWAASDVTLLLFFNYIAALWFGCSNAAPDIVKEMPVFRRERNVGLSRLQFVGAKFVWTGLLTAAQGLLLFLVLQAGERGIPGSAMWQLASILGIAAAGVGMGYAISAMAATVTQAVMIVPLLLIPQMLLSGYVVPAHEMQPPVARVATFVPSFASQRLMDLSLLWQQRVSRETVSDYWSAVRNLGTKDEVVMGEVFDKPAAGVEALIVLSGWILGSFAAVWLILKRKERSWFSYV